MMAKILLTKVTKMLLMVMMLVFIKVTTMLMLVLVVMMLMMIANIRKRGSSGNLEVSRLWGPHSNHSGGSQQYDEVHGEGHKRSQNMIITTKTTISGTNRWGLFLGVRWAVMVPAIPSHS